MTTELTLWEVGSLFRVQIPPLGRRGFCPFRKHKRKDKTFVVFTSRGGDILYKCHSCDRDDPNVGDAVQLYATLAQLDRKQAWNDLRERGYRVPGSEDRGRGGAPRSSRPPPPAQKRSVPPVAGDRRPVLPLDLTQWDAWKQKRTGLLDAFAKKRAVSVDTLTSHDVLEMTDDCIGFGYYDPDTGCPCRVKVRAVERKGYWIVPKPDKAGSTQAKALAPLYLAHDLERYPGKLGAAVITEGEMDALSLRHVGFKNVVSLPDGFQSAGTVSLLPLTAGYSAWLVATDNDEQGEQAYQLLRKRASALYIDVVRVRLKRMEDDELSEYKDANDALVAGFGREDFELCFNIAMRERFGHSINLR